MQESRFVYIATIHVQCQVEKTNLLHLVAHPMKAVVVQQQKKWDDKSEFTSESESTSESELIEQNTYSQLYYI